MFSEADECTCDSCKGRITGARLLQADGRIICAPCTQMPPEAKLAPLKYDNGKTRLELLPPEFLEGVAKVLTFGAEKYSAGNWAVGDGFVWSRLYGAHMRHMVAWSKGEELDPESGLSHLYHAGCMLAFLAAHVERNKGTDDRKEIGTAA